MQLLLDTHIFIYLIWGDKSISKKTIDLIEDHSIVKFISIASIWEMAIKISLGKLAINDGLNTIYSIINEYDLRVLNANQDHFKTLLNLPQIHKDPFLID